MVTYNYGSIEKTIFFDFFAMYALRLLGNHYNYMRRTKIFLSPRQILEYHC